MNDVSDSTAAATSRAAAATAAATATRRTFSPLITVRMSPPLSFPRRSKRIKEYQNQSMAELDWHSIL